MKKKNREPAACPVCGDEVVPPRKYCRTATKDCAAIAKKLREKQYLADIKSGKRLRHGQGPRRLLLKEEDKGKGEVRACLRCGRDFLSFGKQNRICGGCNQSNQDWMAGKTDQFIFTAAIWDGYYND